MIRYTLHKSERLYGRTAVERLFNSPDKHSMTIYPLRVVYVVNDTPSEETPLRMMVSVSKRHFKRAVKRNKVKRQIREAFRKEKHPLIEKLEARNKALNLAFIWLEDKIHDSHQVDGKVKSLMTKIIEKL